MKTMKRFLLLLSAVLIVIAIGLSPAIAREPQGRFNTVSSDSLAIADWTAFYRKYFDMNVDFSDVVIPENPGGFNCVIIIPKGLTMDQTDKALRKEFKVRLYVKGLYDCVTINRRISDHNYAVRLGSRVFSSESLSDGRVLTNNFDGVTLLERLVYELKYFSETGKHLNANSVRTVCAGSRLDSGGIPTVYWYPDGLHVIWYTGEVYLNSCVVE